jgi:hypothetical protein
MSRDIPPFLKDFMNMRRNLHKEAPPPQVVSVKADGKKRTAKGTSDHRADELTGITVAKIIEEKPPKEEVKQYFQKECDRMTKEKMK